MPHSAGPIERLQPASLAKTILNSPACLDVNGGDDVLATQIDQVVLDQVVSLDCVDTSYRVVFFCAKPGMAFQAEVPQVMMWVLIGPL